MSGPRRWREQRWLVDESIRTQTIEFDQPRLLYHLGPVADDLSGADMAVIRNGVKKVADHVPVVRSVAERRERRAREAEDGGHPQSAARTGTPPRSCGRWPAGRCGRTTGWRTSSTTARTPPTWPGVRTPGTRWSGS